MDTKKKTVSASERDEVARSAWRDELAQRDPADFVFVDESGTNIAMTPRYSRAPCGQRAHGSAPRNHGHNTSLIAALTPDGVPAVMTLPGATDGAAFDVFLEQVLVPALRPGQLVIMDNLSVHKRPSVRTRLATAGCELRYLPAYSPDFAPIELAFSKLKSALRRAQARTHEQLEIAIEDALETLTTSDARHWFTHCGYHLKGQS